MQLTIISPHPDDAAFSVGGLLTRLPEADVLLITCFSSSCTSDRNDAPVTTRERKLEDDAYSKFIGANLVRLGLPDSGLRSNRGRETLSEGHEMQLRSELKDQLGTVIKDPANMILFFPLAIGEHPDHIHCRDIALGYFSAQKLVFYEDLPYGQFAGGPAIVNSIVRQCYPHLRDLPVPLSPEQMKRKMEGLDLYKSQLHPKWRSDIALYASASSALPGRYGERYWISEQMKTTLSQWMPL
jgi:LmbE family N-acetylglucosaminyl deacetylase